MQNVLVVPVGHIAGEWDDPDGAPFGLYLYDTDDVTAVTSASLTYWILGVHATSGLTSISWTRGGGMSQCWSNPVRVAPTQKPDGLTYTGYRWTYTCTINPRETTVGTDGIKRVMLGDFETSTNRFQQLVGFLREAELLDGAGRDHRRRRLHLPAAQRNRWSLHPGSARPLPSRRLLRERCIRRHLPLLTTGSRGTEPPWSDSSTECARVEGMEARSPAAAPAVENPSSFAIEVGPRALGLRSS